jgi:hypothetical protein
MPSLLSFAVHDFTCDGRTDASGIDPNASLICFTWTSAWRTVDGRRVA